MKFILRNKLKFLLAFVAFIQLSVNILGQIIVLKQIGAGDISDAYIAAQSVPSVIASILIVAFQSVWLPAFVSISESRKEWLKLQGNAQLFLLIPSVAITIVLCVTQKLWISLLFPGFNINQLTLTAIMAPLFFIASALSCHSALYITALRSVNKYIVAELLPLLTTILFLVGMYFLIPIYGIIIAAYLALLRALVLTLSLHFLAGNPAYNFSVLTNRNQLIKQLTLICTGSSLFKTSPLVDRYWSSHSPSGGLTIYNLSQTAMGTLSSMFDRAICVPNASLVSKAVANKDFAKVKSLYRYSLTEITLISVLIEIVIYFLYPVYVYLLTHWLGMTNGLATDMWLLCLLLIGYLQASAAGSIIVSAFYAMGDMKTPMKIGFLGFIVSILLKTVLFLLYGLKGMAIATSLYYMMNALVMFLLLERKVNARLS